MAVEQFIGAVLLLDENGHAAVSVGIDIRVGADGELAALRQLNLVHEEDPGTGDVDVTVTGERSDPV